jgi:hypothetical protein
MCPDSKYFIKHQLIPTVEKIPEIIDFRLVPYGKAKVMPMQVLLISCNMVFIIENYFRQLRTQQEFFSLANTLKWNAKATRYMPVGSNT